MEKNNNKKAYMDEKIASIKKSIEKYGYDKISTCDLFFRGWSREDYLYMDSVASELRTQGFNVKVSVSYGVTDYYITQ
jgi:hypothetical protein